MSVAFNADGTRAGLLGLHLRRLWSGPLTQMKLIDDQWVTKTLGLWIS